MITYETDYLEHHGVKGMKWGRRKQKIRKGINRASQKASKLANSKKARKSAWQAAAKRRAYDKVGNLKSTKRIVGETILRDAMIEAGGSIVGNLLANNGMRTLGSMVNYAAGGYAFVDAAVGITAAVQRGRGRYN